MSRTADTYIPIGYKSVKTRDCQYLISPEGNVTRPFAPFICLACGEEMLMPLNGQSHALCECGELRPIETRKGRAA